MSDDGTNTSACTRSIAVGRRPKRKADIEGDIDNKAEQHAMNQRRQIETEQRLRPQTGEAPRPIGQDMLAHDAGVENARQQQRIGPDQNARGHAGDGAARGAAPPDQPAEKRRRQLRDGGERQKPDRGKLRVAGRAIIDVGEKQNGEDRDAAHRQKLRAGIARLAGERARRFSINGMTMSFDTMIASATNSTITIAVAADRPPIKATA